MVRRRKKWNLDLLSGPSAGLILLGAMFFLGSLAGCVAAGGLEDDGALRAYVSTYLDMLGQPGVRPSFLPLVWSVIRFPLAAFCLGFTAIGVIGLPVLFVVRGFLLSFAVSAFYRLFGLAGELPAFFLFGLTATVWLPVLFHLGIQGILASYSLLRRAAGDGRYPLRYDYRYMARCGLCAVALGACVALEYFVVPALLQAMVGSA